MKNLILIIALSFSFLNSTFSQSDAVTELIRTYAETLPNKAEVAIGYIQNGELKTVGYHKKDGELIAVENQNDVFEIGSISKTFTAYLLAEQVVNGKVKMDTPIKNLLSDPTMQTALMNEITLQQLVTHTSGLEASPNTFIKPFLRAKFGNADNPYKFIQWKHFEKYLRDGELASAPGEQWTYNNAGFGLLGKLLADQEQTTWESLVETNIFEKYGMKNTYPTGANVPRELFVQGYDIDGQTSRYWDMDFVNPAGSIKSSAADMLQWLSLHVQATDDPIFKVLKTKTEIDTHWKGSKMGNGWIHKMTADQHITWHGGATGAFRSFSAFDEASQTAVVILTNFYHRYPKMRDANGKSLIRTYGFEIMDLLSAEAEILSNAN
ncbi:MAG: serine hydrolase domain-containing protein [Saprospiraceae bacterium]